MFKRNFTRALSSLKDALRFLCSREQYWFFDKIEALESQCDVKSTYNFYGGVGGLGRRVKTWLFDPAYNVYDERITEVMERLRRNGHVIGLHQSFDAWSESMPMLYEKRRVESALKEEITVCRQHWLKFSWEKTWKAQQAANFLRDTTLGFNDRAGFRNASAVVFKPWSADASEPMHIEAVPMVFMDSHFYDYDGLSFDEVCKELDHWIDEVVKVGGEASFIWHQQVMGKDYGWFAGYKYCLEKMNLSGVLHAK